jgi:DNA-directed RNA polymerase specialized sigma24 family protein
MMNEIRLIQKVTWSYVRNNPELEFEEAFSEACLAVLESAKDYDPSKGKRSTFIWRVVSNRLNTIIKNMQKRNFIECPFDEKFIGETMPSAEDILLSKEQWEEMLTRLSPEAKLICTMVNEKDYKENYPKKARGKIFKDLREKGWSHGLIWASFKEIREAVGQS